MCRRRKSAAKEELVHFLQKRAQGHRDARKGRDVERTIEGAAGLASRTEAARTQRDKETQDRLRRRSRSPGVNTSTQSELAKQPTKRQRSRSPGHY